MNTKDIEYYVQIVKQKNFTKVANYFRVSQPTITYALQRLEKEFDTVLITRDRSHHELIVTPSESSCFSMHKPFSKRFLLQELKSLSCKRKSFVLACLLLSAMNTFLNCQVTLSSMN